MSQDAIRSVQDADDRRYAAMIAGDLANLGSLLSDDLIYVHTSGDRDTKLSYLAALSDGTVRYLSLERDDEVFATHKDVMVVSGRQLARSVYLGSPAQLDVSYLAVWRRGEPGWQLVGWHATKYAPTRIA